MDVTTTRVPGVRCVKTLSQSILVIADVASKEAILDPILRFLRNLFHSKVTLVVDANHQSKFQDTYCSPGSTQGRLTACSFEERVRVDNVITHRLPTVYAITARAGFDPPPS